jgi:hypothetical protein
MRFSLSPAMRQSLRPGLECLEDRTLLSTTSTLISLPASTVTGTVWNDLNANRLINANEPRLAGISVSLVRSPQATPAGSADTVVSSTLTDAQGRYSFSVIADGSRYYLQYRIPAGYAFPTGTASPVNALGRTTLFALPAGTLTRNLGLRGGPAAAFGHVSRFGAAGNDSGQLVATDSLGNVYLAGHFSGTIDVNLQRGSWSLTSAGQQDIFLAKYSPEGLLLWVRQFGGQGNDSINGLVCDASDNLALIGSFQGSIDLDPTSGVQLAQAGSATSSFVVRLDSAGNFLWGQSVSTTTGTAIGRGVAVDAEGNVLVTGQYSGAVQFSTQPAGQLNASLGSIFVGKYSPTGSLLWVRSFTGTGVSEGRSIAVDSAGFSYLTGSISEVVNFSTGTTPVHLTSLGGKDIFLARLTPAGRLSWVLGQGIDQDDVGNAVTVDASGAVYLVGNYTAQDRSIGLVARFTTAGQSLWTQSLYSITYDAVVANAVAVDAEGNVYTTGGFQGQVNLDPGSTAWLLNSRGNQDGFVSKLSPAGEFLFGRQFGGAGDDVGTSLAIGANKVLWVTGAFSRQANFEPNRGTANLVSAGQSDGFLLRWNQPFTRWPTLISGEMANLGVYRGRSITPFIPVQVVQPESSPLTVSVTIVNGLQRGDFTASSTAGWTRTLVGQNIVYTQTFTGTNVGSRVTSALQELSFQPRANAARYEKTVFRLSVQDDLSVVQNAREISVLAI